MLRIGIIYQCFYGTIPNENITHRPEALGETPTNTAPNYKITLN